MSKPRLRGEGKGGEVSPPRLQHGSASSSTAHWLYSRETGFQVKNAAWIEENPTGCLLPSHLALSMATCQLTGQSCSLLLPCLSSLPAFLYTHHSDGFRGVYAWITVPCLSAHSKTGRVLTSADPGYKRCCCPAAWREAR